MYQPSRETTLLIAGGLSFLMTACSDGQAPFPADPVESIPLPTIPNPEDEPSVSDCGSFSDGKSFINTDRQPVNIADTFRTCQINEFNGSHNYNGQMEGATAISIQNGDLTIRETVSTKTQIIGDDTSIITLLGGSTLNGSVPLSSEEDVRVTTGGHLNTQQNGENFTSFSKSANIAELTEGGMATAIDNIVVNVATGATVTGDNIGNSSATDSDFEGDGIFRSGQLIGTNLVNVGEAFINGSADCRTDWVETKEVTVNGIKFSPEDFKNLPFPGCTPANVQP